MISYGRVGGDYCLHLQGCSELRQQASSKRQKLIISYHGVISPKDLDVS